MAMITQQDAVTHIQNHDYRDGKGTFAIQFMTADRTKKTGGEILSLAKACGCGIPVRCKGYYMRGIKDMETGKSYAVHVPLIFTIDGKDIYWV